MKCDICKKEEATIHIQEVINNNIKSIHLCENCAKEYGIKSSLMELGFTLIDFLNSAESNKYKSSKFKSGSYNSKYFDSNEPVCSNCGLTLSLFMETGKFGCGNCYNEFKEFIKPLLRQIHGAAIHKGRIPEKYKERYEINRKITDMTRKLKIAIKKEDYKKAALLRDEINKLKTKLNSI